MKYIEPNWPAPKKIKAYTTVRTGWGYDTNENLKPILQLPSDPIWIKQIHSNTVLEAIPENKKREADATYSRKPHHICAVLTADCLPILICNKEGSVVSAIHAGWRGLANGVIEATLNILKQPSSDLLVWLGPAIGPKKFEVGIDVYVAFLEKHPESAQAFTKLTNDKWLADLYALAKIRLKLQNIEHIYGGNFCTYTQENLFFSYRREKNKAGRMASLIWIEEI